MILSSRFVPAFMLRVSIFPNPTILLVIVPLNARSLDLLFASFVIVRVPDVYKP